MPHTHHAAFESFWVSAALIVMALVYVRGWVRIRRLERDSVGDWRAASFLLGVFFIWLAMASPIAALDHELLTVHMVQHLLLMTLAPPLIWLGAPAKPLAHGLPQRFVAVPRSNFPLGDHEATWEDTSEPRTLLACRHRHAHWMAHSDVVHARAAIGNVAWN